MVRVISQETFNEVVRENLELEMSPDEAIKDAIEQFEAQGVDLSNIMKEVMDNISGESKSNLNSCLDHLGKLIKTSSNKENEILAELKILKEECNKSIAHKVYAGSKGAYSMLVDVLEMYSQDQDIALAALNAIVALMNGNPDLLDKKGIDVIINYLDTQKNADIQMKVLEWTKVCCIKHEQNRQDIFAMKILPRLTNLLHTKDVSPGVVKNICCVARALTLDDDIRVQYGKSHEHARELASEILCTLTDLLQKFRGDKEMVSDIILTLTALIVRTEFCQKVEEAGGITFIMDVFVNFPDNEKLNRLSLKLLKGLAGNDDVKVHLIQNGVGPLIVSTMHRHENSAGVVGAGCATIAALCLRCPVNSKALYEVGAPEVILQGMKIHSKDADVQKQGSWAIRNMVSRDKSLCSEFLKLGAEDILRKAITKHGKKIDFDAKAALRDLGCVTD